MIQRLIKNRKHNYHFKQTCIIIQIFQHPSQTQCFQMSSLQQQIKALHILCNKLLKQGELIWRVLVHFIKNIFSHGPLLFTESPEVGQDVDHVVHCVSRAPVPHVEKVL